MNCPSCKLPTGHNADCKSSQPWDRPAFVDSVLYVDLRAQYLARTRAEVQRWLDRKEEL